MNRSEVNIGNAIYPKRCPVCRVDRIEGLSMNHEIWGLYECLNCAVQFWWPMKHPGAGYYEDTYFSLRDLSRRSYPLGWNHRQFIESPPHSPTSGHSLLDIGCGPGTFLAAAKDLGYKVYGLDLNSHAVRKAKELYGLRNIFCGTLSAFIAQYPNICFDVITLFEVLEHVDDPVGLLDEVHSILKPGGFIALSVPNRERFMIRRELGDLPPNHFTWWNLSALEMFLTSQGFSPVRIVVQPLTLAGVIYSLISSWSFTLTYRAAKTRISINVSQRHNNSKLAVSFLRLANGILRAIAHAILGAPGSILLLWAKARGERGWFIYMLAQCNK